MANILLSVDLFDQLHSDQIVVSVSDAFNNEFDGELFLKVKNAGSNGGHFIEKKVISKIGNTSKLVHFTGFKRTGNIHHAEATLIVQNISEKDDEFILL